MKPLYLEMQAFGPYKGKETVDFTKLAEGGIFLIKGPTGSGKTTIFDAMTIALYGGCSGEDSKVKNGRNEFKEWRCNQAEETTDTYVTFLFEAQGNVYRFTRSYVLKRSARSEKYDAAIMRDDGTFAPLFENPKEKDLNAKAEELVGLNKEQFRQVVLLPQGKFERFLTAGSDDKEAILQKIFGTEDWSRFSQKFFDKAKARIDALARESEEIRISLSEEGPELGKPEDLMTLINALNAGGVELEKKHREFDGAKRQEKLNDDTALAERFKSLHAIEARIAKLESVKPAADRAREELKKAEKAETVRSFITKKDEASAAFTKRSNELKKLEDGLPAQEEAQRKAAEELALHTAKSPVAELQKSIGAMTEKRSAYEGLAALKKAANTAKASWKTADGALKTAEEALENAKKKAVDLKNAFDEAEKEAKTYRDCYFAGIYGQIASELTDGEKCPVCGSIHHPEPAELAEDSVSKEQVEAKETAAETAKKAWNTEEEHRQKAETAVKTAGDAEKKAASEKTAAEQALIAAEKNLIEGIGDLKALDTAVEKCREKITAYEDRTKVLTDAKTAKETALSAYKAGIESAKKEKTEAETEKTAAENELTAALTRQGYADVETVCADLRAEDVRKEISRKITEYDTEVKNRAEELAGKKEELKEQTEPDASQFKERQEAITEESRTYSAEKIRIKLTVDRLTGKYKDLKVKYEHHAANITEAESDMAFARKLRGDTGIGLQRYVLSIMFGQVIAEANRMLGKVHDGRYHLVRTDDRGAGNKRGLELKVHDRRSPEQEGRSVGMLSGGEKFLVSLALSIGMSSVAQQTGVRIEALFIDEGFGTLDESSINDAMNVLGSVQKANGMIGIISHVQILESTIHSVLEVEKTEAGSHIKVC